MIYRNYIEQKSETQSLRFVAKNLKEDLKWLQEVKIDIDDSNEDEAFSMTRMEEPSYFINVQYHNSYFLNSNFYLFRTSKKGRLKQLYEEYNKTSNPQLLVQIYILQDELDTLLALSLIHAHKLLHDLRKNRLPILIRDFRYIIRSIFHFLFKSLDDEDTLNYLLPLSPVLSTNNLKSNEKRINNYRHR